MSNLLINVTSCYLCPFAHREKDNVAALYCAINKATPDVGVQVMARQFHEQCPLKTTDFAKVIAK